jgi:hypothetical protein
VALKRAVSCCCVRDVAVVSRAAGVATARDRRRMMWPWRLPRGELAIRRTVQWQRAGRVGAAPSGLLQAESALGIVDTVPPYSVWVVLSREVAWTVLAESLEHTITSAFFCGG